MAMPGTSPWGLIYMLCGAFLFSVASLLAKQLNEFSSVALVFWRSVVMLIGTTTVLLVRGENPLGGPGTRLHSFVQGVANFVSTGAFYFAVRSLHLSDAVAISYTSPMITGVAATVLFGEPWGRLDALGSFLSMTGVLLVCKPSIIFDLIVASEEQPPLHGLVAAVAAALSSAGINLLWRWRRDISPLVSINYIGLTGVLCGYAMGERFTTADGLELAKLIAMGGINGASLILMIASLKLETAGKATAMNYLQVLFAYVWQVLIFHHCGDTCSITGAVLISCWGAISLLKEFNSPYGDAVNNAFLHAFHCPSEQLDLEDVCDLKVAQKGELMGCDEGPWPGEP